MDTFKDIQITTKTKKKITTKLCKIQAIPATAAVTIECTCALTPKKDIKAHL